MSIQRCNYCDVNIDTDFDAEHFETESDVECIIEEQDKAEHENTERMWGENK